MKKFIGIVAALALLAGGSMPVMAAVSLSDLPVTGLGLGNGGIDSNYQLTQSQNGETDSVVVGNGTWPVQAGGWITPTNADAKWISAGDPHPPGSSASGEYRWVLEFIVPDDAILDTIKIVGGWSTDNGSSILLNGVTTGNMLPDNTPRSFQTIKAFEIVGGFDFGLNKLEFVVNNGSTSNNNVGLLVNSITASFSAVPEPTTLVAWSGLAAIGGIVAYRRRVVA